MIYITGDAHGEVLKRISKLRKMIINKDEQTYLIITGDCGIVWDNKSYKTINYIEKWIKQYFPTLKIISVLGNHENYDMIYDLPKVEMFDSKVFKVSDSIYFFENGNIYNIEGNSFGVFGGAFSIDRMYRKLNKSYWLTEIPSYEMKQKFIDNLDEFKPEYLLTHTTSFEEIRLFDKYAFTDKIDDEVAHFLRFVKTQYQFKHHWFGHFHMDKTVSDINSTCLYWDIIEFKMEG